MVAEPRLHSGRLLRSETIEAHNLSGTEAAKILGVSRDSLSSLQNAKADRCGAKIRGSNVELCGIPGKAVPARRVAFGWGVWRRQIIRRS